MLENKDLSPSKPKRCCTLQKDDFSFIDDIPFDASPELIRGTTDSSAVSAMTNDSSFNDFDTPDCFDTSKSKVNSKYDKPPNPPQRQATNVVLEKDVVQSSVKQSDCNLSFVSSNCSSNQIIFDNKNGKNECVRTVPFVKLQISTLPTTCNEVKGLRREKLTSKITYGNPSHLDDLLSDEDESDTNIRLRKL